MATYKIMRLYADESHPQHRSLIATGLSFEQARQHCNKPSTHQYDLNGRVIWFDGFERE